jgi:hypothetical protein
LVNQSQNQIYVTTDSQSASLSWCQAPIWGPSTVFYYFETVTNLLMWGAFSDERTGLSFTIAAGPRQRNHFSDPSPTGLMPMFYCLRFETAPTWRARSPRIYILQEKGDPVIPLGIGFPFRHLLRLAGLCWKYSNKPPREV